MRLSLSSAAEAQDQGEEEGDYKQRMKADMKKIGAGIVSARELQVENESGKCYS